MSLKDKNLLKRVKHNAILFGQDLVVTASKKDVNSLNDDELIDFYMAAIDKHLEDVVSIKLPIRGMATMKKHQRREMLEKAFFPEKQPVIATPPEKSLVDPSGKVIHSNKFPGAK